MIVLIDNFDSFSYNLQDYLRSAGDKVLTLRYDLLDVNELIEMPISGLVISPGPGQPKDYPKHFALYNAFIGQIPILGVCLGHQSIACHLGASLIHAPKPMHGKVSTIHHIQHPMYQNVPIDTDVTRYHSLLIEKLPNSLSATAFTANQEIMSFAHKVFDVWAYQFHPEAHLTEYGQVLINNWLKLINIKKTQKETQNTLFGVQ